MTELADSNHANNMTIHLHCHSAEMSKVFITQVEVQMLGFKSTSLEMELSRTVSK